MSMTIGFEAVDCGWESMARLPFRLWVRGVWGHGGEPILKGFWLVLEPAHEPANRGHRKVVV